MLTSFFAVVITGANAGSASTTIIGKLSCNPTYFQQTSPSMPLINSVALSGTRLAWSAATVVFLIGLASLAL
jgi:hypothetical protein